MTITADVYDIAIFLIGLGFFIIAVALVPAILQLKRTFKAVEDLTQETRKTVEIVNFVGRKVQDQTADIEELIARVKDLGVKVTGLGELVVDNVRGPVINFLSFLFGAEEGFKRFFHRDRAKKGGGTDEQL
ncbi:MAG: hypothetical protein A2054_09420 [Deltaproteobacteria bacterium GWA2_55_10]|nr:MAG: hypothetical protein A2054_09420 [Deltaproteobacteria bacterium GWA2_55_10]